MLEQEVSLLFANPDYFTWVECTEDLILVRKIDLTLLLVWVPPQIKLRPQKVQPLIRSQRFNLLEQSFFIKWFGFLFNVFLVLATCVIKAKFISL